MQPSKESLHVFGGELGQADTPDLWDKVVADDLGAPRVGRGLHARLVAVPDPTVEELGDRLAFVGDREALLGVTESLVGLLLRLQPGAP